MCKQWVGVHGLDGALDHTLVMCFSRLHALDGAPDHALVMSFARLQDLCGAIDHAYCHVGSLNAPGDAPVPRDGGESANEIEGLGHGGAESDAAYDPFPDQLVMLAHHLMVMGTVAEARQLNQPPSWRM